MTNEIIYDKTGRPDIMVAFTPDELGLPATVKGRSVEAYLISKYPNTLIGGVPYSLPYQKPAVNVDHDEAIRLCESKGEGWHLFTNDEWAALALWSLKNGTLPRGNTNDGKSHSHPEETGTTYPDNYGKTLTGSGPVTWNHDHTAEGVADLCGNVWEHVGGIRFLNGQAQVIPNNEAAAGADQSKSSKEWTALYTPDGDPIYFNPVGGEIFLQDHEAEDKDYDGDRFADLHASEIDVPDDLIRLGLYPPEGFTGDDYFWVDNDGERCVFRGGRWNPGTYAGVFSLNGNYSRSNSGTSLGFRSAFVRYSGGSGNLENLDDEADDLSGAPEDLKEQIRDNAEKLNGEADSAAEAANSSPYPIPDTLPGMIRLILANVLTEIYTTAGGQDTHTFQNVVCNAGDNEIKEAVAIAQQLAQLNISVYAMRRAVEQVQLATTTTVTIGSRKQSVTTSAAIQKEAHGHE